MRYTWACLFSCAARLRQLGWLCPCYRPLQSLYISLQIELTKSLYTRKVFAHNAVHGCSKQHPEARLLQRVVFDNVFSEVYYDESIHCVQWLAVTAY